MGCITIMRVVSSISYSLIVLLKNVLLIRILLSLHISSWMTSTLFSLSHPVSTLYLIPSLAKILILNEMSDPFQLYNSLISQALGKIKSSSLSFGRFLIFLFRHKATNNLNLDFYILKFEQSMAE